MTGTPAHSRTTSTPRPPVIARTVATGSPAPASTVSKPIAAALARRPALRSTRITRPAPADPGGVAAEQADRARRPVIATVSPGRDVAAVGDVEGDRGRVDDRALVEGQAVGQREDRLHARAPTYVGVGALDAVAVLLVEARPAVVLAQVVAALDALLADAAGVVGGAGHAVARPVQPKRSAPGPRSDDLAGPLVARDEREGRRPEARVVAPDEVGVGAADRHRPHPARTSLGPGAGTGTSWISNRLGSSDDEGLHGRGHGGSLLLDDGHGIDHRPRRAADLDGQGDEQELVDPLRGPAPRGPGSP